MGSGWHEWPLVLFTVLGQCVVGALIVSGLGWLTAKDDTIARQRIVRSMFFSVAGDGAGVPRVDYASRLADARV